jgi:hypothetical protein
MNLLLKEKHCGSFDSSIEVLRSPRGYLPLYELRYVKLIVHTRRYSTFFLLS